MPQLGHFLFYTILVTHFGTKMVAPYHFARGKIGAGSTRRDKTVTKVTSFVVRLANFVSQFRTLFFQKKEQKNREKLFLPTTIFKLRMQIGLPTFSTSQVLST